jgi:hypothetical protein
MHPFKLLGTALCLLGAQLMPGLAAAQDTRVPDSTYNRDVPTIQDVLDFEPPERFASFYETEKLLHRWAARITRARNSTC